MLTYILKLRLENVYKERLWLHNKNYQPWHSPGIYASPCSFPLTFFIGQNICCYGLSFHCYADNTQVHQSRTKKSSAFHRRWPEMTNLWPDLVLWSSSLVNMEGCSRAGQCYERKMLRYTKLETNAQEWGSSVSVWALEVGCRGFLATSTYSERWECEGRLTNRTAENGRKWQWIKRKDWNWASKRLIADGNELGTHWWTLWRCCGPVSKTLKKEGAHLKTQRMSLPI